MTKKMIRWGTPTELYPLACWVCGGNIPPMTPNTPIHFKRDTQRNRDARVCSLKCAAKE